MAAFLFDQEEFDATYGFRCCEKISPRGHALGEENAIPFIGRPIFEMHGFDSARIGFDPRDGVGTGFFTGTDIQLKDKFLGRVGGNHFKNALAAF